MNTKSLAFLRSAPSWIIALVLVGAFVFSAVSPAYAAPPAVKTVTVGTQTGPALVYGAGGTVTFDVTVTVATKISNLDFTVSGLPAGASVVSFVPPTLTFTAGSTKHTLLTIQTTNLTPSGAKAFTVTANSPKKKSGTGTLTVGKRPLTITANDTHKEYGDTLTFAGTEFIASGLVNSDSVTSASLSSTGAVSTAAVNTVLGYPIVINSAAGTGLSNYSIHYVNGKLFVDKKELTVTGIIVQDKYYDGTVQASIDASDAVLNGVVGTEDVHLAGTAAGQFTDANAGLNKVVNITGLTLQGTKIGNYTLTQPTATGNINKAEEPVVIYGADAFRLDSDLSDPPFTYLKPITGFVNGEDESVVTTKPTCSVPVVPHNVAGHTYAIVCNNAVATNYNFAYVDGTLTVDASNHAPSEIYIGGQNNASHFPVNEFQRQGTLIGYLTADDADRGDTVSFALENSDVSCNGADNNLFVIAGAAGDELQIAPVADPPHYALDYETQPVLHICLRTTDAHLGTIDRSFTIDVQNHTGTVAPLTSTAASDGYIMESPTTPGNGGAVNAGAGTLFVGDSKSNLQYLSVLSFNTAPLPDDAGLVFTKVTLRLHAQSVLNHPESLGNLVVDLKQPNFGIKTALEPGDFQALAGTSALATLSDVTTPTGTPKAGDWYTVDLTGLLNPNTTAAGLTQLRLRFDSRTANAGVSDLLAFYSGNTSKLGDRPQLSIEYSRPSKTVNLYSVATLDGQILESGVGSNTGGAIAAGAPTLAVGNSKTGQAYRSILSFNTALLPDEAIITGAQLQIKAKSQVGTPFASLGSLVVDLRQPSFGKLALEALDFKSPADHAAMATITSTSSGYSADLDPSLFNVLTQQITTQMRLRFTGSVANNAVLFYSGNNIVSLRPVLVITYSIP